MQQPPLRLEPRFDCASQKFGNIVHLVVQSLEAQPARYLGHRIKLASQACRRRPRWQLAGVAQDAG
jgi:hypothetical protein